MSLKSTDETIHILNQPVVLEPTIGGKLGNREIVHQIVIRPGRVYRAQLRVSGLRVLNEITPPQDNELETRGGGYHS